MTTHEVDREYSVSTHPSAAVSNAHTSRENSPPTARSQRLASLDAIRGFDMLLILGAGEVIQKLAELLHRAAALTPLYRPMDVVANQFNHKAWEGIALEDLIFPLFVFIVGVSIVFSLSKALQTRSKRYVVARILGRTCLLYVLGVMIYHGLDQPIPAFEKMDKFHHAVRWLGVLQRIAICYGVSAMLFCLFRPRTLIVLTIAILIGYWLLMSRVNVPGVGRGSYAEGRNLANYLDARHLGGYKWDGDHDPEGLLSTLPAVATCLLGVFAGLLLHRGRLKPGATVAALILGGAALAAVGYAWGFVPSHVQFPVIKKLWTSSYVLLAGGYSAMLLGAFYLVMDVWRVRGWAMPFIWVGTNAITLYMFDSLGFTHRVAALLIGGHDHPRIFGASHDLLLETLALAITLAVGRFLYRRNVFIRV